MKSRFWFVTFGWILFGFSPAAMELAFRWPLPVFVPVTLFCSITGAWALFKPERRPVVVCTCVFLFMNMSVALILGCSRVEQALFGQ